MAMQVVMPQGGQDIEKGTVVQWLRKEGDTVRKGDVICEVETEKTVIEVCAPQDGILLKTYVAAGEEAKVLSVIAMVGTPGEVVSDAAMALEPAGSPKSNAATGTGGRPSTPPTPEGAKLRVSPKARRLAEERGVDLRGITGTGPQGSIAAEDVIRAPGTVPPAGEKPQAAPNHGRLVPMTKVGIVTARRMTLSKLSIPHFYVTVSVDMTAAKEFRSNYNSRLADPEVQGISITDLITRSCVLALADFPAINSTVRDESTLILWDDINIGIATATDAGLVVPVLEGAGSMTLMELATTTRRIVAAAREGRQITVAPARFTISNMGMHGVDNFIAIINPPEAAILSVSSVKPTIVPAQDGTPQVRDLMNLTLSMDHRVGDGVVAARFLNRIRARLEDPAKLG